MSRKEYLLNQREHILISLSNNKENKAKLVAKLLDIDHEIERYYFQENDRKIFNKQYLKETRKKI